MGLLPVQTPSSCSLYATAWQIRFEDQVVLWVENRCMLAKTRLFGIVLYSIRIHVLFMWKGLVKLSDGIHRYDYQDVAQLVLAWTTALRYISQSPQPFAISVVRWWSWGLSIWASSVQQQRNSSSTSLRAPRSSWSWNGSRSELALRTSANRTAVPWCDGTNAEKSVCAFWALWTLCPRARGTWKDRMPGSKFRSSHSDHLCRLRACKSESTIAFSGKCAYFSHILCALWCSLKYVCCTSTC